MHQSKISIRQRAVILYHDYTHFYLRKRRWSEKCNLCGHMTYGHKVRTKAKYNISCTLDSNYLLANCTLNSTAKINTHIKFHNVFFLLKRSSNSARFL